MENIIKYNKKDHKNILIPNDDAATVNCGRPWRMPTEEECKELLKHTTNYWITDYKGIERLNGRIFKSKINGNEIFIPAAGYLKKSNISSQGFYGLCWSSDLSTYVPDDFYYACSLCFGSNVAHLNYYERYIGLPVRPVLD